jgi:hypothetical protein
MASWLVKNDGLHLCRDCTRTTVQCDGCGEVFYRKHTVTCGALHGSAQTLCRACMLRDEQPIEVMLVRSNWAPWAEQEVVPVGDLLCAELAHRRDRKQPKPVAALGVTR